MRVELLTVPDCPNRESILRNIDAAIEAFDLHDVHVTERCIETAEEARVSGMNGSPTLLIDGVDPFAERESEPSLSCRLFLDDDRFVPVPTTAQLGHALSS